ncbi:MAG TPA: alpha-amylase family glycosyl hydrolase [Pseudogracilibacillus sp.]|nr:alpha-amylase family glycosyl hydrolase [Pseudogracilibacillus sp.]
MRKVMLMFVAVLLLIPSSFPEKANAEEMPKLNEEIIYDILVDRYNNGRQAPSEQVDVDDPYTYNGGDIKGVTDSLETIDDLGFTTISLSPIMENAPKGYHGYWIEDPYEVEEEFGSMEDLEELVEKAHDRKMKVILEFVPNYIAKSSPIVEEEDKQDWFKEVSVEHTDATEWLEDVFIYDQTNQEVQDYLIDTAKHWMNEVDIDGFKIHAADQAEPAFLEKLVTEVKKEDPYFYFIAESLQEDADMSHLLEIEEIDAVANVDAFTKMNDIFTEPDKAVKDLYDARNAEEASTRDLLYVDNINTARFSNNFADNGRNAVTTWTLALSYLYFTPGVPIVYQGSEVPMYGPGYPENRYLVDFSSADPDVEEVFDTIAAAREEFPALVDGDFEEYASDEGMSLFKRTLDDETVYFAINNDSESRVVKIPGIGEDLQLYGILHDDTIREDADGELLIGMERESVEVFVEQPNAGFNWGFIVFVGGVLFAFVGVVVFLTLKQRKREKSA